MIILIEGQKYNDSELKGLFENNQFFDRDGSSLKVNSVGYYHSYEHKKVIYLLPKVFMKSNDETVFGLSKSELVNLQDTDSFKHKREYLWVRQICVHFYNSLIEYRKRKTDTSIINRQEVFELNTSLGDQEYSFLDLLLSFVNFYKKNKRNVLFKHIEIRSNQIRKPNWNRTIRNTVPFINNSGSPIYFQYRNRKKVINWEEELFTYFFSILNHFNVEHSLYLKFDPSFKIIEGAKFLALQRSGLSKLRKIKHRYFNDTLTRMYRLCEMYFSLHDQSSLRRRKEEFLCSRSYNLIFEDMIDKLFTDELSEKETNDGVSLGKLKNNDDGKIIDHLYEDQSLIDRSNIFFIGDSKYYKPDALAGKTSKYKQFTYAKNVIQYNIDLLNEGKAYSKRMRYRDDLTEGYNITPNFFVYGNIHDFNDFEDPRIVERGNILNSYHFDNRLFDRDTLFVHQYQINFLFALKSYTTFSGLQREEFRSRTRKMFRNNFLDFFNDPENCDYNIYEYVSGDIDSFVSDNFKLLLGKSFRTKDGRLLIAIKSSDNSLNGFLADLNRIRLE